jgi:hypothetical protein
MFQNSCQDSMSDPFILDNWMVRFLMEHSSDLSERQMPKSNSSDGSTMATNTEVGHTHFQGQNLTGPAQANHSAQIGAGAHGLSGLLQIQDVTSRALVDHAIDWLLD